MTCGRPPAAVGTRRAPERAHEAPRQSRPNPARNRPHHSRAFGRGGGRDEPPARRRARGRLLLLVPSRPLPHPPGLHRTRLLCIRCQARAWHRFHRWIGRNGGAVPRALRSRPCTPGGRRDRWRRHPLGERVSPRARRTAWRARSGHESVDRAAASLWPDGDGRRRLPRVEEVGGGARRARRLASSSSTPTRANRERSRIGT